MTTLVESATSLRDQQIGQSRLDVGKLEGVAQFQRLLRHDALPLGDDVRDLAERQAKHERGCWEETRPAQDLAKRLRELLVRDRMRRRAVHWPRRSGIVEGQEKQADQIFVVNPAHPLPAA